MAIPVRTFKPIPEGVYVFYIYEVEYNEDFGKLKIKSVTQDGQTNTEFFNFYDENGNERETTYNIFAWTAKAIMGEEVTEVEPSDFVGKYFEAEVVHTESDSKTEPGKKVTFINLKNKQSASGFDGEPSEKCKNIIEKAKNKNVDLDSLLGG